MNITKEMAFERFDSLPKDMQRAINDDSVSDAIREIGDKYEVRMDKMERLVSEVGLIMLGFKKTNEFIKSLSTELEIDRETAESIAIDVDSEVFKKIRESLRTVQFDQDSQTADHDKGHEDVVPSPGRDSLLKEIEDHASNKVDTSDMTSSYSGTDYDPSSFASTVEPSVLNKQRKQDTYRESTAPGPTPMEQEPLAPTTPLPMETPFEREQHEEQEQMNEVTGGAEPEAQAQAQPTQQAAESSTTKPPVEMKQRINNDPYKESID